MKKTFGIILLVIVGLNLISIFVRMTKSEPIGANMLYYFVLIGMLVGGVVLINKDSQVTSGDEE